MGKSFRKLRDRLKLEWTLTLRGEVHKFVISCSRGPWLFISVLWVSQFEAKPLPLPGKVKFPTLQAQMRVKYPWVARVRGYVEA